MGKFTEYKLPLKSMPVGTHSFEYQLGKPFFSNMENNDVRDADIKVALTVVHKNDFYDLSFAITGEIIVACDRCLDDLPLPVDTTYHIAVKYGEEYSDDSDDFLEIPYSDNDINVAYMIHDTVALAIPIKHVHPQGKCNRAMSAILKKHRSYTSDSDDAASSLDEEFFDDDIDIDDTPTDSRWDKLKGLNLPQE